MSNEWMPDKRTEAVLTRCGLKWELKTLTWNRIDIEKSKENHARTDPINEDVVEAYQHAMANGDCFPAGVAIECGDKYVALGGNHRIKGARAAGRKDMLFYVVRSDDAQILEMLPRELNLIEGVRMNRLEAIEAAAFAVRNFSMRVEDASNRFGISKSAIREKINEYEVSARMAALSILSFEKIPATTRNQLGRLKNDNVLVRASQVVKQGRLTATDTTAFVRSIEEKRTESEQLSMIAEFAKTSNLDNGEAAVQTKKLKPIASQFRRALALMEASLRGKKTFSQLQITKEGEVSDAKEKLIKISKAICTLCGKKRIV